jgi:predicted sulfurtransferase
VQADASVPGTDSVSQSKNKLVLDCRNIYESEVGRFEGALPLPTERFMETWDALNPVLDGKDPDGTDLYIYCTGGIRCEKVGAWLTQVRKFKVRRNIPV